MAANNFSLSVNIKNNWENKTSYIPTPNTKKVIGDIIGGFNSGIHSYTIIGTYGTGKSSFLMALESDISSNSSHKYVLSNTSVLGNCSGFEILNIVGDYTHLSKLIGDALNIDSNQENVLDALRAYYEKCKKTNKLLLIVIDEFGKVLEHAAQKNPERELYFLQKLAEFVNVPSRKILLLTTLHQNFSAYGRHLNELQKNEWTKVKGRFQEVVFVEPVEHLLFLAAEQNETRKDVKQYFTNLKKLQNLAKESKFISDSYTFDASQKLFPLDPFSAYVITRAIQRYGQNERSLFSFLLAKGKNSFREFIPSENRLYNLQCVYDYIENNFYSYLQEANVDSMNWSGMRTAIERVEGLNWDSEETYIGAIKIVKAIGLLNLFGKASFNMDAKGMSLYSEMAMNIKNANDIIEQLINFRIVRFAKYKNRLILFEGTDINIEDELSKANLVVPKPQNYIDDLRTYFAKRIALVKANYFQYGTPRYFKYLILSKPEDITPKDDTDGYVQLIFPKEKNSKEEIIEFSSKCEKAIVFVIYNNTEEIIDHLYKINKYDYLLQKVLIDKMDNVANREVNNLKEYEKEMLNKVINEGLFSFSNDVIWIFKGREIKVNSQRDFNKLLSLVCKGIYNKTPIINNELINRYKLSSSISTAKSKYIEALLQHSDLIDFGFPSDKFPPEKTIYYTLLKNSGLHENGMFNDAPKNEDLRELWNASEEFLKGSIGKVRKISELQKILLSAPYKLKQGVLDFWIPTYLFIKRQDYALYDLHNGRYIPVINKEFFDLLQKHQSEYGIKAFKESGIHLAFYNQYRKFIRLGEDQAIKSDKFIETIKPFLMFYNRLNDYARHTNKFDHKSTIRFRDVLAHAKDPEKTFFEDLPQALGYNRDVLNNEKFVQDYCLRIQQAINDLRSCYNKLLDRIEIRMVDSLGLSSYEYKDYIPEIKDRLKDVKVHLLTSKQKEFYFHLMTDFNNRSEWFQSICYTALGQSLETLRDEQEEELEDNLIYLFKECEKYANISSISNENTEEAFSFDLVSQTGENLREQTYVLPKKYKEKSDKLEKEIDKLLTGDKGIDICTLLRIIKKRANNEN